MVHNQTHDHFWYHFLWGSLPSQFVMAYPQAPIEMNIYMELPQGIQTAHGNSKYYVLKLEKNSNGQKQAGHVWNSLWTSLCP
jgi:hypothetical protein